MAGQGKRKFFVLGNWKMNGSKGVIDGLVKMLNEKCQNPNTEVVMGVPSCYLMYTRDQLDEHIGIAAQNCHQQGKGAFTGETSCAMVKDCGAKWVIVGHVERRHIYGESNALVGEKAAFALDSGLNIIIYVGEKPEQRIAGKTEEVLVTQLNAVADKISDWNRVVLAYEDIGMSLPTQEAEDAHAFIRKWVAKNVNDDVAQHLRILYGGHVNGKNCTELASCPDIDGFVVGGASLKPEFAEIVDAIDYCHLTKAAYKFDE